MAARPFWVAVSVTAVFCFALTFARVVAQPVASTSVIMLVIYFAGLGGGTHTLHGALGIAAGVSVGGCVGGGVEPRVVAGGSISSGAAGGGGMLYDAGAAYCRSAVGFGHGEEREAQRLRMHELQRSMRMQMEAARTAVGNRREDHGANGVGRSLAVLLETADILFVQTIRWTELAERVRR